MQQLKIKKLTNTAILPKRNFPEDAGLDIYSDQDLFIEQGTTAKVKTSISIEVPVGYVGKLEDRSGLASKGLRTGGGVIDAGFTGPVEIILHNLTNVVSTIEAASIWDDTKFGYKIKAGDRIAQLLLYKVESPEVVEVTELISSNRGDKGLGSSGV